MGSDGVHKSDHDTALFTSGGPSCGEKVVELDIGTNHYKKKCLIIHFYTFLLARPHTDENTAVPYTSHRPTITPHRRPIQAPMFLSG